MLKQFVFVALLILNFNLAVLSQSLEEEEVQPSENWLKQYTNFPEIYLFHRFDLYSKKDLVQFKAKFDKLIDFENDDNWEGIYYDDLSPVGFSQFRWKSDSGYLHFYVYTCLPELRSVSYGNVIVTTDYVQLLPEFAVDSPRKFSPVKFVKVKWNDRRYLVEESSLSAFAEKAVGIYVEVNESSESGFQAWSRYWVRGDLSKDVVGLPEFPAKYKSLQRFPINAKIISVGKRTIEREKELGDKSSTRYFEESAQYLVKIDAGKNHGVKKGIWLGVPETKDEIFVTKVNEKTSVGLILRDLDDNKNDLCRDENYVEMSCPKIKLSQTVKSYVGHFGY